MGVLFGPFALAVAFLPSVKEEKPEQKELLNIRAEILDKYTHDYVGKDVWVKKDFAKFPALTKFTIQDVSFKKDSISSRFAGRVWIRNIGYTFQLKELLNLEEAP